VEYLRAQADTIVAPDAAQRVRSFLASLLSQYLIQGLQLSRLLELHRIVLFDCITQYRASFADDGADETGRLLSGWLLDRMFELADTARKCVPSAAVS
jgi:hypothetical protein